MSPHFSIAISLPTLQALLAYHASHGDAADPSQLADLAIRNWLQRQQEQASRGQHGYWWKSLFLPEGSRLRITDHHSSHYATVMGDELDLLLD